MIEDLCAVIKDRCGGSVVIEDRGAMIKDQCTVVIEDSSVVIEDRCAVIKDRGCGAGRCIKSNATLVLLCSWTLLRHLRQLLCSCQKISYVCH